jgi:alpha,alpha-trehalase
VCLNALLYQLEVNICHIHEILDLSSTDNWMALAKQRASLIDKYCWDPEAGLYFNYNFVTQRRRLYPFATTFYPLWAGIASREQAQEVKNNLNLFEDLGGIVTSTNVTGCKWDAPFGCAPLQYFAVMGLTRYQYPNDAKRIAIKFVVTVARGLEESGLLFAVYNLRHGTSEVERDLQFGSCTQESGFGWTNGVVREFLAQFHLARSQKGWQPDQKKSSGPNPKSPILKSLRGIGT